MLRGDLYRPEGDERRPVLLQRTPYGKDDGRTPGNFIRKALARGYAVFVQDVRGRYASDGVFDPYRQEGRDGYDTVEWIATQPWSNGRVGTYGLSYPRATQWLLAVESPPHLGCIFPAMTFSSAREFFYFGGAFDMSWLPYLLQNIAPDIRRRLNLPVPPGGEDRAGRDAAAKAALWHVPLNDLPGTRHQSWFLRTEGRLATEEPGAAEASDAYTYDPADPVVDPHGGAYSGVLGPFDQQDVGRRKDVLVYNSEPLGEELEVTGNIEIRLWISSSAPDTDFHVHVLDVEPDGRAWNLMSPTVAVIRARYRGDECHPELMTPGRPYELTFRLPITSNCFLRGHRIRAHVMSSFFPHLDRNANTGRPVSAEGRMVPARQTVLHDASHPSRLILPVIRG